MYIYYAYTYMLIINTTTHKRSQSYAEAFKTFTQAADLGNQEARFNLGALYIGGWVFYTCIYVCMYVCMYVCVCVCSHMISVIKRQDSI